MDRNYKAFISYRHLPLDMRVAKQLHRRIERFTIPKSLRKNGEKKLGYVFRDKDELPISSDLSANIRTALDHSEFLIVICTPETSNSLWVLSEISYFLEHHDRDHVLALLADGSSDVAFPAQLREIRSADGEVISRIEPLAANIVADSDRKRDRLFRTESLRLLAALIGCSYDELYRREQRYRHRRLASALAAVTLVASCFIGVLLDRNAKIAATLRQTQIQESRALAALSWQSYEDGDYFGALNQALDALPGRTPDRPYVPEAEAVLAAELAHYYKNVLHYTLSIEQESPIMDVELSRDAAKLLTLDNHDRLRCFDAVSGEKLWEKKGKVSRFVTADACGGVLFTDRDVSMLDLETGETRWTIPYASLEALSADGRSVLISDEDILVVDTESGEIRLRAPEPVGDRAYLAGAVLSGSGRYAAFLEGTYGGGGYRTVWLLDLETGEWRLIGRDLMPEADFYNSSILCFTGKDELVFACNEITTDGTEAAAAMLFDPKEDWARRYETPLSLNVRDFAANYLEGFGGLVFLDCRGSCLALASAEKLVMLDADSGAVRWELTLPSALADITLYDDRCVGLALSDGTVTIVTDTGALASMRGLYSFESGYPVSRADLQGELYIRGSVALVPNGERRRAAILRWKDWEDDAEIVLAESKELNSAHVYPNPSGRLLLCLGQGEDGGTLWGRMLDPVSGESGDAFRIPGLEWNRQRPGEITVCENGLILARGFAVEPDTGKVVWLNREGKAKSCYESKTCSAWCASEQAAFTASVEQEGQEELLCLWKNAVPLAEVPCPRIEELRFGLTCGAMGGNGIALLGGTYSQEPSIAAAYDVPGACWLPLDGLLGPEDGKLPFTLAEEQPWLALQTEEDAVRLLDLRLGREVRVLRGTPPAEDVVRLVFADHDRLLLLFSGDGDLTVFETETGERLYSANVPIENLHFSADARYEARVTRGGDRLLVIFDDTVYREAGCLVLDLEHWERVGVYHGVCAYLPEADRVVVKPYREALASAPLYTTEQLIAMAERALGNTPAEAEAP